jgi:hypothetical protein
MLSKEEIKLLAKYNNLSTYQQEMQYIQSILLNILSDELLIFKGGTYLWFFHGLNRFSEDIDFTIDSENIKSKDLKKYSLFLIKSIEKKLWLFLTIKSKIKIINFGNYGFSLKVSVEGPLYSNGKGKCAVKIDISAREYILLKPESKKLEDLNYKLPIKYIKGMNIKEVCAEKVRAIFTREQARDVYDLWFLLTIKDVKLDLDLLNKKLKYYDLKFTKKEFIKKLKDKKEYFSELKNLIFEDLNSFDFYYKGIIDNINF